MKTQVQGNDELLIELREIKADVAWLKWVHEMELRNRRAVDEVIKSTCQFHDLKMLVDFPPYLSFDDMPEGHNGSTHL